MTLILWKIIIASILFVWITLCIYLAQRVFKLKKTVETLQIDRGELIEARNKLRLRELESLGDLSKAERQIIIAALNMPEYEDAIADPKTSFAVKKVYRDLKEKIKESLKD